MQDTDPEVCLFKICNHLQVNQPSVFGKIIVEMYQREGQEGKNSSTIEFNNIVKADSLLTSSNQKEESPKPNLLFNGSSDEVTIKAVCIDKSFQEVHYNVQGVFKCTEMFLYCDLAIINSSVECELLDGSSIDVVGRLRCGATEESNIDGDGAKIYAKKSFMLNGVFQCYGKVMVEAEEIFDQRNTGRIDIFNDLELTTGENGSILLEGSTMGTKETNNGTSLDVAAKTIKISGKVGDLSSLKLSSENDLIFAKESRILSCQLIDINGEWITAI